MTRKAYESDKRLRAERSRRIALAGRDIGEIPKAQHPKRRELARLDLRAFCDTYLKTTFSLPWSPDHLKVLDRARRCVIEGGQFAMAMPRGSGKTSLCEAAALWSMLYAHRRFVALIGASETHAQEMLDSLMAELEHNDELYADFPEVCYPIRCLEGIANRCAGQLHQGQRTEIVWTQNELVLPTIEGSKASGAIVKVAGLTGRIRGMKFKRADGSSARPDLVICDDCQTDESANSLSQCVTRERILSGAVLGLAGPASKIAALMPCTVIRPGDMADVILDRKKHPEWNGERTQLIYEHPTDTKLWEGYAEVRAESLRQWGDIRDATKFYREHREQLDAGARIAWPERFHHDEASAIQHAINLRLQDEVAFWSEYQNQPMVERGLSDVGILTADQIAAKVNGIERGMVPLDATRSTAFVDVQQNLLYYAVVAWRDDFTGYVIDYGAHPDQARDYFTLVDAQHTLGLAAKGAGLEGAILAGLEALTEKLFGTPFMREDMSPMRPSVCLIDASWGTSTAIVHQFCKRSVHAANLMPSHGHYIGPGGRPIEQWKKKPGDRVGLGWHIGAKTSREARRVLFDSNYWKSFLHARLAVTMGDHGCLSLYGRNPNRHRMIAEHLTSEFRTRMQGSSRVVDIWKLRPGQRENHLLDCLVGAGVAASILGVTLQGMPSTRIGPRRKVSLAERAARSHARAGWHG